MKYPAVMKRIGPDDMGRVMPFPIGRSGFDALAQIGEGEPRMVIIQKDRNPKLWRLFRKQLRVVVDNSDKWNSPDHLYLALKIALGIYDLIQMMDGTIQPVPRSADFEHMDDDEFKETFFDPAQPLLSRESGIPEHQLQDPDWLKNYTLGRHGQ